MVKNVKQFIQKQKKIFTLFIFLFVIAVVALILFNVHKKNNVYVAFYDVPQKICDELSRQILKVQDKNIYFKSISSEKIKDAQIPSKYDILFSWSGKFSEQFVQKALPVSNGIANFLPSTIKQSAIIDKKMYALPLLIDHYEISYYKIFRNQNNLKVPQTLEAFENYLRVIQKNTLADLPLFCAGADDQDLLGFVSVIYEALNGSEKYNLAAEQIRQSNGDTKAIEDVIEKIKSWQNELLLNNNWLSMTEKDGNFYMKEHRIGAYFMLLSEHRQKEPIYIKYYDTTRFPVLNSNEAHALVAPTLNVISFGNSQKTEKIVESLIFPDNQSELSTKTQLAITSKQGISHDSQADDVRFFAASYQGGPVPNLAAKAFSTKEEQHEFAEKIRAVLRK